MLALATQGVNQGGHRTGRLGYAFAWDIETPSDTGRLMPEAARDNDAMTEIDDLDGDLSDETVVRIFGTAEEAGEAEEVEEVD
jgi:hypothetical protein